MIVITRISPLKYGFSRLILVQGTVIMKSKPVADANFKLDFGKADHNNSKIDDSNILKEVVIESEKKM